MARSTRAVVVAGLTAVSVASLAGAPGPNLNKAQRALLLAVVTAVDAAASRPATEDVGRWQTHTLRTSDGSHYVAFSVAQDDVPAPGADATIYVRLATRPQPDAATAARERSAVQEWLDGQRSDPLAARPSRVVTIPSGEMPVGGVALGGRTGNIGEASAALRLMDRQREKEREAKEAQEKARRAELEQQAATPRAMLPFEDFSVAAAIGGDQSGAIITRSITAGPGDYDLLVGWAVPPQGKAAPVVHVTRHALRLPAATASTLGMSSVILANRVGVLAAPYPPEEQTAHPYSIGLTDIEPAADNVYRPDERLALVFQVYNAQPTETGKPDVQVTFRVVRVENDREVQVATLSPQRYHDETLPPDFDLRLGHPIFAAVAAPLATLRRGDYRLKIGVSDLVSGTAISGETAFVVAATLPALLTEAPPVAARYRREAALDPALLGPAIAALAPARPSPALSRALGTAAAGRFIDLLREEPVEAAEQGVRAALTGIALYALGDASAPVQFQRALQAGAPAAPVHAYVGADLAAKGRDADAAIAWREALAGGMPAAAIVPLVVDASLRRGDGAGAAAALAAAPGVVLDAPGIWRTRAAADLAAARYAEAARQLEARVAEAPGDLDARWLLLHALFGECVRLGPDAAAAPVDAFMTAARPYIDEGGPNAALAADWLRALGRPAAP